MLMRYGRSTDDQKGTIWDTILKIVTPGGFPTPEDFNIFAPSLKPVDSKRLRAIGILRKNNKRVNDKTIKSVMEQLE